MDVPDFHNGDTANRSEINVATIVFVNDAGDNTIEYDFTAPNGRRGGIVVSGSEGSPGGP